MDKIEKGEKINLKSFLKMKNKINRKTEKIQKKVKTHRLLK